MGEASWKSEYIAGRWWVRGVINMLSFWNSFHYELGRFYNSLIFSQPPNSLQLKKAIVLAESSEYIHFHCDLSAPAMSTDMSLFNI